MAYCPRCGVEVEERLANCPLCATTIPAEVRGEPEPAEFPTDVIPPKPMYRRMEERQKRKLAAMVIAFTALFPTFLTLGLDFNANRSITWSYYVLIPIIGVAGIAWCSYRYRRRPVMLFNCLVVIILAVQTLIDIRLGEETLFLSPALPFFFVSFLAVELILLYLIRRRPGVLKAMSAMLFDAMLLVLVLDYLISSSLGWSLVVLSAGVPVLIYLLYLLKVKKRGINLAGFFFLDLSLMLVALDLSTSSKLDWSAITALVFLTLSMLFYTLHVVLYNDVDWKKALHL